MLREEALAALTSLDADERLKAARFFAMSAVGSDRRKLRAALKKETVPWIKRALERSLSRAAPVVEAIPPSDPPTKILAELRAEAIDEVASTIIHELATLVARLRIRAPIEVKDYPASDTKTLVDSLAGLLAGIRNIKTAVGKPEYFETDIAAECREACAIFEEAAEAIRFAGQSPFLAEIDPGLFKLALTNLVRNAVEATSAANEGDAVITLNWGRAGHELWVAVIDNGPGFDHDPSSLVDLGQSTKEAHIGFGLATAKQAMQAMEGDIYPSNASGGGARVELRWFGAHENTVR
ncbi:sensor histidine kinase [Donghicola tyrosinivorans]|uniref:histidine kinase n=1 Tax=Donghicola tyrosinivorans TaxID=1652492 RepID=A0A2T0WYI7_9RHOB|nr:HAMP domain-containing sensor histidine kinase [Donghicola tyrosinivorans]PRY91737.1 signal transduction histidine kinase [Donghicola tyrosinivorans]